MKILVYLILGLFCIGIVSAIINNPNLPQITRKAQTSSSASNNNTLNVNNSNCWQSDCGGFRSQVNQGVNTTSNVQFRNLTVQNFTVTGFATGNFSKVNDVNTTRCWWDLCHPSAFDSMFLPLSGGGTVNGDVFVVGAYTAISDEGRNYFLGNDGVIGDVFQILNDAGRTLIQSLADEDLCFANDDETVEDCILNNGLRTFVSQRGYQFKTANNVMTLNVTNTTSRLNSNLTVVGSIGIGTTNPVNKLDVVGRINATTVIANASNATRPAYSFTGDEDTGWYSNGAGNMAYTSNGFLRFWFSSDGQFNFGSLTPSISNSTKTIFPIAHDHNGTGIYRGYNETSGYVIPHQVYNYNGSVALNTQYNNTLDRPIMVSVTGVSTVSLLNDIAYFTMKNGAAVPDEPQAYGCIKQITGSVGVAVYCQLTMTVPSGYVWTVNSTIGGSGTTAIEIAKVTVL